VRVPGALALAEVSPDDTRAEATVTESVIAHGIMTPRAANAVRRHLAQMPATEVLGGVRARAATVLAAAIAAAAHAARTLLIGEERERTAAVITLDHDRDIG
jgi:hypothetical protein